MPPTYTEHSSRLSQACAECKRLKLRCDKKKPCSSCVRRGCPSICPEGRLTPKGTRYVLANTEQLHARVDSLVQRVRQLENALEVLQTLHYSETHPLLTDELRSIATPLEESESSVNLEELPATIVHEEGLSESMGTLALNPKGVRYFGPTATFAAFLFKEEDSELDHMGGRDVQEVLAELTRLPTELSQLAYMFPFRQSNPSVVTGMDTAQLGLWIRDNCLPTYPEAWTLFETYWEHYAWHFTPFTRTEFIQNIFSPLYRRTELVNKPLGHALGLIFMVFAIAELVDFTKPLKPNTGVRYYLLARASLCLDAIIESPTLTALQAMHLMLVFGAMARGTVEIEHLWMLSGVNVKLALTLGLQHNPEKFKFRMPFRSMYIDDLNRQMTLLLAQEEIRNRQHTLIAVLTAEMWQGLMLGRPPAQTFANFQWLFPSLEKPNDTRQAGRHWAARFMRDCSSEVLQTVLGIKPVTYASILRLDKKIRDYPEMEIPEGVDTTVQDVGFGRKIQHSFVGIVREVTSLFLHRRCFALALRDHPEDPLRSPFGPSVLACYRSAMKFIDKLSSVKHLDMSYRVWFLWPNAFIATVILGSIVARSPGCSLAASAFLELEKAATLWESAPDYVCRPRIKVKLERLKQKAYMAFAQHHAHKDSLNPSPSGVEVQEEINVLGGGVSRVVSPKGHDATKSTLGTSVEAESIPPSRPLASSQRVSLTQNVPTNPPNLSGTIPSLTESQCPPCPSSSASPDSVPISSPYSDFSLQQPYPEIQAAFTPIGSSTPPSVYGNTPGDLSGYQSPLEFPSPSQLPQYFNDVFGTQGSPFNGDISMPSEEEQDILKRLCLISETWQTTMDTVSF